MSYFSCKKMCGRAILAEYQKAGVNKNAKYNFKRKLLLEILMKILK